MPFPYTFPLDFLTDNVVPILYTSASVPLATVMAQLAFGPQGQMRHPLTRDKYRRFTSNGR